VHEIGERKPYFTEGIQMNFHPYLPHYYPILRDTNEFPSVLAALLSDIKGHK
jgi:hypothetical protein